MREGRTAESVHGDRIKVGARKVYLADPHAVLALERQLEASVLEWGEHLGPRRPLNQVRLQLKLQEGKIFAARTVSRSSPIFAAKIASIRQ